MPKDWCPFDPGSGRVPDQFDVLIYPNDFPAFSLDSEPFSPETGLYAKTGARGSCDVVIYHPEHNLAPSQLSAGHWRKIVDLWIRRHQELAAQPDIQYVFKPGAGIPLPSNPSMRMQDELVMGLRLIISL